MSKRSAAVESTIDAISVTFGVVFAALRARLRAPRATVGPCACADAAVCGTWIVREAGCARGAQGGLFYRPAGAVFAEPAGQYETSF